MCYTIVLYIVLIPNYCVSMNFSLDTINNISIFLKIGNRYIYIFISINSITRMELRCMLIRHIPSLGRDTYSCLFIGGQLLNIKL